MIEPTTIEIQFLLNTPKDLDFTPLVENNNELIYLIIFVLINCLPFSIYLLWTIISFNKASDEREIPETSDARKMPETLGNNKSEKLRKYLKLLEYTTEYALEMPLKQSVFLLFKNPKLCQKIITSKNKSKDKIFKFLRNVDIIDICSCIRILIEKINDLGCEPYNKLFMKLKEVVLNMKPKQDEINENDTKEIFSLLEKLPRGFLNFLNLLWKAVNDFDTTKINYYYLVKNFFHLFPNDQIKDMMDAEPNNQEKNEIIKLERILETLLKIWADKTYYY